MKARPPVSACGGLLAVFLLGAPALAGDTAISVPSLGELAMAAAHSGQTVAMQPGTYRLIDWIPLAAIPDRRAKGEWQFLNFSGSSNTFALTGVTIEVDTALRRALRPPIHTDEFLISGNHNTIDGLTITNIGDGTSHGGAVFGISGRGNTLRTCTLHVRGSAPYGYGDLFGKGGQKHSGVHITGDGTRIIGCRLVMRSFGHGFYVQEDAADVRFEDCHVEGAMRPTDEILGETAGLAFERGFRTEMKNRSGEARVTPGYMKALSEDGFRTYGQHRNLSFRNCTARNMRGGFELRTKTGVRLENCSAFGNERAFWISSDAAVVNCRGDAQYGPLLFLEGDNARVEVELAPAESAMQVHALATIQGAGHRIAIKPSPKDARTKPAPILVGFGTPGMGEGMAPIPERPARGLTLTNDTPMPVVIGAQAADSTIVTRGPVAENNGRGIAIIKR